MNKETEDVASDIDAQIRQLGESPNSWKRYLPSVYRIPSLRLTVFNFWDCSYTTKSLTKLHFFDVFIPHYRKWWHLPICGFQIWV